ncbi:acetyl-CoA C-acetyltransferase [Brevibacterium sp. 91QC2O2]|uniref:acetyl-CoA C-acetyltransferase n=1 Tax=Brevibacterium TaxID=1696 RepID=UPI00211CA14F|nr:MULTISPECIES: acetyl-CoA C-acetyltransferase [unclassified Brevibacterium]MCQ9366774.1 acetyl-CoA C-acetyltransferase [Brevibacterium sp. 91QC2O2]MCQ9384254.1 acetyl-CoA C-acetyltransferase [Brevibacterium sp. 68QC2CO]
MTSQSPRRAAILGGNRIPFARSNREYSHASNQDMFTSAIDGLVARYGLAGRELGEVAGGAVLKHSRDFNLTRETVLGSALASTTPAFDLGQACATGLEAVVTISQKIRLGQIDSGIAGGVDSASDAPLAVGEHARGILLEAMRSKTLAGRVKALSRLRPSDLAPAAPSTGEPRTGLSMGEHQARTTADWAISRQAQDDLALASHRNLAAAWDAGFFDDLVTPYLGVVRDTNLRPDSTPESLAGLRPVFGTSLNTAATMTAGNSTPLTDGASAVLLGSEDWAQSQGLSPLAYLVDAQAAAVDFVTGDEGLLMAPAYAVPRLLERNGLSFEDIDVFEIHEAFASTVLCHLAAWESEEFCRERLGLPGALGPIDRDRLNPLGSSLAAGHPFAATGGRIIATTAKYLHATGKRRALVSICAAGGQGLAAIVEAA